MRLFFAIPLPLRLKDELARFQARARHAGVAASWPDPQGLHLTLAFLGEQDESSVPAMLDMALQVATGHSAFPLRTFHLGGFPKDSAARVLWLGVEEQPALPLLAEDLRRGLRVAALTFDDKPFKAHLTVARFKTAQDVARFQEPPSPMAFEAQELVLLQSVLTPSGSRYVSAGSAPLGMGAA